MAQGFDEILGLYQASVRKSPALMMETINVDSNRGVTSRGNSPYDKYASPATRAKVLESRMQEIEAFARSRSLSASAIYALAEAAMRTGKIPDLGQFGLAGDDAVATKQFLISNVLNIAGLEWTDYKGDPVVEDDEEPEHHGAHVVGDEPMRIAQEQEPPKKRRRPKTTAGGYQMADTSNDPARFMAEGAEGMQSSGQKLGSHWAKHTPNRVGSAGAKRERRAAHKAGRRAGQADAEQGMSDYEQDKEEREEHLEVDPTRFMAEAPEDYWQRSRTDRKKSQANYDERVKRRASQLGGTGETGSPEVQEQKAKSRAATAAREAAKAAKAKKFGIDRKPKMDSVEFDPMTFMGEGVKPKPQAGFTEKQVRKFTGRNRKGARRREVGDGYGRYGRPVAGGGRGKKGVQGGWGPTDERKEPQDVDVQADSVFVDPSRFMAEGDDPYDRIVTAAGHRRRPHELQGEELKRAKAESQRRRESPERREQVKQWKKSRKDRESRKAARAKEMGVERKPQMNSLEFDPFQFMAEEKDTVGGPSNATLSPNRMSDGGDTPHKLQDYERNDLLSKEVMAKLRKIAGDGVYGYSREDLFRLARERGLLGTEEAVEEAAHLGAAGNDRSAGSAGLGNYPGPTTVPWEEDEKEKRRRKQEEDARSEVDKILGIEQGDPRGDSWPKLGGEMARLMGVQESVGTPVHTYMTQEEVAAEEKALRERSETDKILGIMPGDPRGDAWPKLGGEMARLMNLEDQGVFRAPRGINMDEPAEDQIDEMTTSGGLGGFIGGGMMGGGMMGRTCAMPSYDASYQLPEDPDERVKALNKLLNKGKKKGKKVQESEEIYEPAPNSTEVPTVRDEAYDAHPSRFMKRR